MSAPTTTPTSQDQWARDLFVTEGPMSLRALAIRCVDLGVYAQDTRKAQIREAERRAAGALKILDEEQLPFAGPTPKHDPSGAAIWVQRALWDEEDSSFNIQTRGAGALADVEVVKRLNDAHEIRYGYRVALPPLTW